MAEVKSEREGGDPIEMGLAGFEGSVVHCL
jgi:hypothetical protein